MRTRESLVTQLMMVCGQGTFFYTQGSHYYTQHTAHGPEPDASHQKQLQRQICQIHLYSTANRVGSCARESPAGIGGGSPGIEELLYEARDFALSPVNAVMAFTENVGFEG